MSFERLTVKRTVVVEGLETDKEFVRRVITNLNDDFRDGMPLNQCPNFSKTYGCDGCSMNIGWFMKTPEDDYGDDTTSCALIAMKRMTRYVCTHMRTD